MTTSTSGMIRLSALPDRVLLNILRRRGYTLARNGVRFDDDNGCGCHVDRFDTSEFVQAEACYRVGDLSEAMIWLERALPGSFAGLADRVAPIGRRAA